MPQYGRRRRWRPSGATLFVVLMAVLVVGLPAFIVLSVVRSVDDATDSPSGFGNSGGDSSDEPSLVLPDRLGPALERIRAEAGSEGSAIAMRIDPNRISAVMRKADGSRVVVIVARDLDVTTVSAGSGGDRGLSLNRIDPKVPDRLARAAAERLGRDYDDLSYLALSATSRELGGGGSWSVFFGGTGGANSFVTADLDGRNIRIPGQ